jgi:hypothetical protein
VVELTTVHSPDSWWVGPTIAAVIAGRGRILHAACGDGWLVQRITAAGGDAYGVDPRPEPLDSGPVTDLRGEDLAEHLRAVAPAGLGGVVLTGVVDGMASGERTQLLQLISSTLAPDGTLVVHSVSRSAWDADDAPFEADLAPGRPLRAETWRQLLERSGYQASVQAGPDGRDYLVTAVRATVPPPEPISTL